MEILVVDDEKHMASLFQDYLEIIGSHKVTVAHSGSEALEKIKMKKPDLIILDQYMPGLTGVEVVGELKNVEDTKDIPVVIFSVADRPSHKVRKSLGILGYFSKPIDFKKLKQIIAEVQKEKN